MPIRKIKEIGADNKFAVRDNTRTRFIPERGYLSDIQSEPRVDRDLDITDNPMGWMPGIGDVLQAGQVAVDFGQKKYGRAAINAGLLLVPNIVERPIKQILKGAARKLHYMPAGTISLDNAIWRPYKGTNFIRHELPIEAYSDEIVDGYYKAMAPSMSVNRIGDFNVINRADGVRNNPFFYSSDTFIGNKGMLQDAKLYPGDAMTPQVYDAIGVRSERLLPEEYDAVTQKILELQGTPFGYGTGSVFNDLPEMPVNELEFRDLPSNQSYFEAKMQRSVPLNEFKYGVFADPASSYSLNPKAREKALRKLSDEGMIFKTFMDKDDRIRKIMEIANEHSDDILFKHGGLISRLKAHYKDNAKVREAIVKANGGEIDRTLYDPEQVMWTPEDEIEEEQEIKMALPMPDYNIFADEKSYGKRDKHLTSLDAFIDANPTVAGLDTADFRDILSAFAGLESSYSPTAANKSGYSGYYGLKNGKDFSEAEQHRKAYEHLADMFKHNITKDDIQKGMEMGYTPAQILYKYWNQRNNATEFFQNGKAATIGNNPELEIMGNNIGVDIDFLKYVPDAIKDDYHIVEPGDNFSTIQERVRVPGRHYNQAGKDLKRWNTEDIVNGKLKIGDKVWFTEPYSDGGLLLNDYKSGGKIHIKPSKRGTFTAAAKKHGKSVQAFASQVLAHKENYSPAMVKKANFARNFGGKWHAEGGILDRYGPEMVRNAIAKLKKV